MSQDRPPRPDRDGDAMTRDAPGRAPSEAGATIEYEGGLLGGSGSVLDHPSTGAPAADACPSCGHPLEAASRFCQACGAGVTVDSVGADRGPSAEERAEPEGKLGRWFWPITLLWLVLMVAALWFLYSRAIVVGAAGVSWS